MKKQKLKTSVSFDLTAPDEDDEQELEVPESAKKAMDKIDALLERAPVPKQVVMVEKKYCCCGKPWGAAGDHQCNIGPAEYRIEQVDG